MKETLQELLRECLKDAKGGKGSLDPGKYPSQVCPQNDLHQNNVDLISVLSNMKNSAHILFGLFYMNKICYHFVL